MLLIENRLTVAFVKNTCFFRSNDKIFTLAVDLNHGHSNVSRNINAWIVYRTNEQICQFFSSDLVMKLSGRFWHDLASLWLTLRGFLITVQCPPCSQEAQLSALTLRDAGSLLFTLCVVSACVVAAASPWLLYFVCQDLLLSISGCVCGKINGCKDFI